MAVAKISSRLFLMRRRAYSVAAESGKMGSTTAPTMRKVVGEAAKEVFWMRDPNTGYWIPENHIGEDDVADLKSKLLSKKPTTSSSPSN